MKVLALDTASATGSVALLDGERLIAETLLNLRATHSERLLGQIRQVLAAAGLALTDLDLIAAVSGPGSFTGLRVGLATAKGLAHAAGLPLIGVSTLRLLAMNLPLCPLPVCAFLDARKREVYTALFTWRDGLPQPVGSELVLPPAAALHRLEGEVALVGDGVLLYRDLIDEILSSRAHLPALCHHQPRAAAAAVLASRDFSLGAEATATGLKPVYIRPSDAEISSAGKR